MPFDSAGFHELDWRSFRKRQILERMHFFLQRGWCQGRFREGMSFCLVGALDHAASRSELQFEVAELLVRELPGERHSEDTRSALTSFNDYAGRAHADVLAVVMRAHAAVTEAGGSNAV